MRWAFVRPWLPALAVAVVSLASVPADGAELRERVYQVANLVHVDVWSNLTLSGGEANLARQEADSNDDLTVTPDEATAYEDYLVETTDEGLSDPQVLLDRAVPRLQKTASVAIRGIVGPATSSASVEYDFALSIDFVEEALQDEHRLQREARTSDKGPLKVTVPAPFVAIKGRGIDDFAVMDGGRTVTGRSDGVTDLDLIFMHQDAAATYVPPSEEDPEAGGSSRKDLPGLSPSLSAAGCASAALGLLRRRA